MPVHNRVALGLFTVLLLLLRLVVFHPSAAIAASSSSAPMSTRSLCTVAQFLLCLRQENNSSKDASIFCYDQIVNDRRPCVHHELAAQIGLLDDEQPTSAQFINAHFLRIHFPKWPGALLYILEWQNVTSAQDEAQWRHAGAFAHCDAFKVVQRCCHAVVMRTFAALANDTVVSFDGPSDQRPVIQPPLFMLNDVRRKDLYYDTNQDVVVARYYWNHPKGYAADDVDAYNVSIHVIQCATTSASVLNREIRQRSRGADLFIKLAPVAVLERCWFKVTVQGVGKCPQAYTNKVSTILKLKCYSVENFSCPLHEQKPKCLNRIGWTLDGQNGHDLALHWTKPKHSPIYFHLRWGVAKSKRVPTATYSDVLLDKLVYNAPALGHVNRWEIDAADEHNEKLDSHSVNVSVQDMRVGQAYGFQLCAVYNMEFKQPSWRKVPITPVLCQRERVCTEPSADQPFLSSPTLARANKSEPESEVALQWPRDILVNFRQEATRWTKQGVWLTLSWRLSNQVAEESVRSHHIQISNPDKCGSFEPDKHFVLKENHLRLEAILMLSHEIVHGNCSLEAQIRTTMVDGAVITHAFPIDVSSVPLRRAGLAKATNASICIESIASFRWTAAPTPGVTADFSRLTQVLDRNLLDGRAVLFRCGRTVYDDSTDTYVDHLERPVEWTLQSGNATTAALDLSKLGGRPVSCELSLVVGAGDANYESDVTPSCAVVTSESFEALPSNGAQAPTLFGVTAFASLWRWLLADHA